MQYKKYTSLAFLFVFIGFSAATKAQNRTNYWQQHVDYKMDVIMDVKNYQYKGKQELVYTNNSADTLKKVYYHLLKSISQGNFYTPTTFQNDPHFVNYFKNKKFNAILNYWH